MPDAAAAWVQNCVKPPARPDRRGRQRPSAGRVWRGNPIKSNRPMAQGAPAILAVDRGRSQVFAARGRPRRSSRFRGDGPNPAMEMGMPWLILLAAGLFEVGWAVGLKYAEGFTRPWPTSPPSFQ